MKRRLHTPVWFLVASLLLITCARAPRDAAEAAPPQDGHAAVNGVRLHYLDWGGTGPTLVLIHGLGASAWFFDPLAQQLRDDFRVIAYSRRGHGHSEAPEGPYDNATLVEDLRQVLDTLGIAQAHLLGWSMGGNEITEFAGRYPDRVLKLVYLEAGYDWSDPTFLSAFASAPVSLEPDSAARESLDAYRAWFQEIFLLGIPWMPAQDAYLQDVTRIGPDGLVQSIPTASTLQTLFGSLATTPRDYRKVRAPALALYATSHFGTPADSGSAERIATWEAQAMVPFRRASMDRIRAELPDVTVMQVPNTNHVSIGLVQLDSLAATIRQFLTGA